MQALEKGARKIVTQLNRPTRHPSVDKRRRNQLEQELLDLKEVTQA